MANMDKAFLTSLIEKNQAKVDELRLELARQEAAAGNIFVEWSPLDICKSEIGCWEDAIRIATVNLDAKGPQGQ